MTESCIAVLDAAGESYAIQFRPQLSKDEPFLLAFSNRIGYVHIVDMTRLLSSDGQMKMKGTGIDNIYIESQDGYLPRQILPITYYALYDPNIEMNPFPSILRKIPWGPETKVWYEKIWCAINGLMWTPDGKYLYVATNGRTLAFPVRLLPTLKNLCIESIWNQYVHRGNGVHGVQDILKSKEFSEMGEEWVRRIWESFEPSLE